MDILTGITPADVSLKDLEVFYNPRCLNIEEELRNFPSQNYLKKVIVGGSVVLALHGTLEARNVITIHQSEIENSDSFLLSSFIDKNSTTLNREIEYTFNIKSKALNEDEINEIEILDAYYAVASKMYPKIKPVIL